LEASEEDKVTIKQILSKLNVGKSQSVWHIKSQKTSGQTVVVVQ
jgi:hypothetical protein